MKKMLVHKKTNTGNKKTTSTMKPSGHNKIMVIDVESNKLLPKKGEPGGVANMPYILQLSYIVYNCKTSECDIVYNNYINVAETVEISEFITGLTGITREKCRSGKDITDCLLDFYNDFTQCDCVVAHNYEFDSQVIQGEIERNIEALKYKAVNIGLLFDPMQMLLRGIRHYCTMKESVDFCNILVKYDEEPKVRCRSGSVDSIISASSEPPKQEKMRKKFPKLSELYQKIFHYNPPKGLHNSLVDVIVCLRCFMKLKMHKPITDKQFEWLLTSI